MHVRSATIQGMHVLLACMHICSFLFRLLFFSSRPPFSFLLLPRAPGRSRRLERRAAGTPASRKRSERNEAAGAERRQAAGTGRGRAAAECVSAVLRSAAGRGDAAGRGTVATRPSTGDDRRGRAVPMPHTSEHGRAKRGRAAIRTAPMLHRSEHGVPARDRVSTRAVGISSVRRASVGDAVVLWTTTRHC